jgi:hypothetical protein
LTYYFIQSKQTLAVMKKLLLVLLLALGLVHGYSQDPVVRGKVVDENGKPLSGATVALKGTTTTVTDADDNFQISKGNQIKPVLICCLSPR